MPRSAMLICAGCNNSISRYQAAQNGQPEQTVQTNFYSAVNTTGGFFGSAEPSNLQRALSSRRMTLNRCPDAFNQTSFPGRVPQVRQSVPGTKKTGRSPFQCFCAAAEGSLLQASGACIAEKGYLCD
jgi:hypothetical protein